ncbi:hypothetical protein ACFL6I_03065 [candidate division KSB1 bacterium]
MNIYLLLSSVVVFIGICIAAAIMINIHSIIRQIHTQIQELDSKLTYVQFPENHIVNLERLSSTLKKIVRGIRSIGPGND